MDDAALLLFKMLSEELDPALLQRKFIVSLIRLHDVDRGSIWIKKHKRYLCVEAAGRHGENIKGVSIPANQPSIVGWVIENGKMTACDPENDPRHNRAFEEKLDIKSRLILCFPLHLQDGTVYGAVQIINTQPGNMALDLSPEHFSHIQALINIVSTPLSNALRFKRQQTKAAHLKQALQTIRAETRLIGQSRIFTQMMERITSYANTDYPVLISGASGTGKELVAQQIHRTGPRSKQPFLVQNCSAIPEALLESELFGYRKGAFTGATRDKPGLFEAAAGGTVFLDEIGEMPAKLQARILRVIQSNEIKPVGSTHAKQVDVRLISATNRDLAAMVAGRHFRQDLYYRLAVLPLTLPPLADRPEDIPLLINQFLTRESLRLDVAVKRIEKKALNLLMAYRWPGNVRELENLIRYLLVVVEGKRISTADLPRHIRQNSQDNAPPDAGSHPPNLFDLEVDSKQLQGERPVTPAFGDLSWNQVEDAYTRYLLGKYNWNVTRAAEVAGVNRSTFASRLRRLGIRRYR